MKETRKQVHTSYRVLLFEGIINVNTFLSREEYVFHRALEQCVRVGSSWLMKQRKNEKRTILDAEKRLCSTVSLQAFPSTLVYV